MSTLSCSSTAHPRCAPGVPIALLNTISTVAPFRHLLHFPYAPTATLPTHVAPPPLPHLQLPEEVRLAFARGELNLLLATSVGAEGLDFRCVEGGALDSLNGARASAGGPWLGFSRSAPHASSFFHPLHTVPSLRHH